MLFASVASSTGSFLNAGAAAKIAARQITRPGIIGALLASLKAGKNMVADQTPEFVQLVDEHHAVVYRYAFRLTGSVHDAEDLTQQTFLAAYRKLDQLRERQRARSWLCSILRNAWLKAQQRRIPMPASSLELDLQNLIQTPDDSTPIDREQLQRALDDLAPEFKVVLLMFYFEGLSYRAIAEQLVVPLGTVMSRLARGKAHLRKRLEPALLATAGQGR
jgi:RNA polymerase sigma-70 factor (ECF subfamily)